ncbi:copper amine oxidase N-terminal domain-containing protein [Paenibacillus daejeonensis]|uniref:copper amine oxidase N-terminal domain-containing protein n=1 Tax=Paenibacillus daejeonensis TaxID=135193 RepID=UPI0003691A04|nr:copper amine oxidase N-terminal domain-containing protein [Paenibacillus daejeonensis]
MKSITLFLLILLLGLPSLPAHAGNNYLILLDGRILETEERPVNRNGSMLVPMRTIFEALGASVSYDAGTKRITGQYGEVEIVMGLNAKEASRNGETLVMSQPPALIDDRVYVPIRFVSEALGAEVEWDAERQAVQVYSETVGLIQKDRLPVTDESGKSFILHSEGNLRLKWSHTGKYRY